MTREYSKSIEIGKTKMPAFDSKCHQQQSQRTGYTMKLWRSIGRFMKTSVCLIASGMSRNGGQGVKPKASYSDTALFI